MKWKIFFLAAAMALTACSGPRPTNAKLQQLHRGMSEDEVLKVLGRPTHVETSETLGIRGVAYYYRVPGTTNDVKVVFINKALFMQEGSFKE